MSKVCTLMLYYEDICYYMHVNTYTNTHTVFLKFAAFLWLIFTLFYELKLPMKFKYIYKSCDAQNQWLNYNQLISMSQKFFKVLAYQKLKINMYLSLILFLPSFLLLEQLFEHLLVNWELRLKGFLGYKESRNIH